ncbi:hypothetical protein Ddye_001152 [Dipteronia dyeriana]|uniref:Transcription factor MYB39 n=1 Tax=Dipteronia dyeriana TaxID=168575 RepID=A0AAE0CTQ9_9ROSI|nr:hypothetical protein Ddye_001152 [Dipteronia dyeriana]
MVRSPCCNENNLKKGPWTPEEDEKLVDHINKHGYGNWKTLPKSAGLNRCGKSCRLRWTNYLRPDIKRGKFSQEEERIIINLHSVLGNKWSKIATHLPGRTDNEIKNFWNTNIRKKLLQMGIDPTTHKPRTDLNHLLSLSQLLSTAQFGNNLMNNPLDNIALGRLQTETTQLAKIQLLQSLLQVINSSTLANNNGFLGTQNVNPFEGVVMAPASLISSAGLTTNDHQAFSNLWSSSTSMDELLDGIEVQDQGVIKNVSNYNIHQDQNTLPPLVSVSHETSSFRKMEGEHLTSSSPPESSTIFEAWEKLMDDETSGSYWKDILE